MNRFVKQTWLDAGAAESPEWISGGYKAMVRRCFAPGMKELLELKGQLEHVVEYDGCLRDAYSNVDAALDKANWSHAAMGMAGEAGEVLDAVKKYTAYGQELNREHLLEELGDTLFYFVKMCQMLDVRMDEVAEANMGKLAKRYSSGSFSSCEAEQRADKAGGLQ